MVNLSRACDVRMGAPRPDTRLPLPWGSHVRLASRRGATLAFTWPVLGAVVTFGFSAPGRRPLSYPLG
jgi:hypothetical protein